MPVTEMSPWLAERARARGVGDEEGEVGVAGIEGGDGEGEAVGGGGEGGGELVAFCLEVGVGGVDLLVDGDVKVAVGGFSGDVDVAVGVVDGEEEAGGEGGEGFVEDLGGEVALVVEELGEVVGVDGEAVGEEVVLVVDGAGGGAEDGDEDEEGDDAAADATAQGRGAGGGGLDDVLVEGPLGQEDDAGEDEQGGPPAGIPAGEGERGPAARGEEERGDAEGGEQEGAEDGTAAKMAGLLAEEGALGSPGVALRAGLELGGAGGGFGVVAVWRGDGGHGGGVSGGVIKSRSLRDDKQGVGKADPNYRVGPEVGP